MSQQTTSPHFSIDRAASDYLRAVAIILVILSHLLYGKFDWISTQAASLMGTGGVSIFLLLSGYGLYCSWQSKGMDGKSYWSGKLRKVFLPYMIITALYWLYLLWIGVSLKGGVLLENLLCIDFDRNMDETMWYMSFLLIWYFLFFLLFYFNWPTPAKIGLLLAFGFAFRSHWLKETFAGCAWQFHIHAYTFPLGVLMGWGMDLANRKLKDVSVGWKNAAAWVLAGISLVCYVLGCMGILTLAEWQSGVLLFIVLYRALRLLPRKLPVLAQIGSCSFILYLLEGKLIGFVSRFATFNTHPWLYLTVYAFALAASVILYRFCENRLNR